MTQSAVDVVEMLPGTEETLDLEAVTCILEKHDNRRGGLVAILQDIQEHYGYLPEQALRTVARRTKHSLVDVYGVATFYRSFSLQPRGEHLISVCLGTACHVRGAPAVAEEFERQLGIRAGETTTDMRFTLETVNCLGACALGPIVVLDGHYFSNVTTSQVKRILSNGRKPSRQTRELGVEVPQIEKAAAGVSVG